MAADGSIIIDVNLDDKQAQQELNRLNKRIQSLADQISNKEKMKLPLVEQSRELSAELDAAKVKLQSLQSAGNYSASAEQIADQKERVRLLQAEWNKVQGKVERYDESIQKATVELNTAKSRAGELQKQLSVGGINTERMAAALQKASAQSRKFTKNISLSLIHIYTNRRGGN